MVSVDFSILVVLATTLFVLAVMMAFLVPSYIRLISVLCAIGYGVLMLMMVGVYILGVKAPLDLSILFGIGLGIALSVPLAGLVFLERKIQPAKEEKAPEGKRPTPIQQQESAVL